MIDLYTFGTPNGRKVSIALEELELPYRVHSVNIVKGEQRRPEFLALNPNGKIPVIVDAEGPDGQPLKLFESGAILLYLAEKTGRLLPRDAHGRYEALQWVMFQMGGLGPMFGQLNHFRKYAPEKVPYADKRYTDESKRLLRVLDGELGRREWIAGQAYSVADISCYPWVRLMGEHYPELLAHREGVQRWLERVGARPAVQRGLAVP